MKFFLFAFLMSSQLLLMWVEHLIHRYFFMHFGSCWDTVDENTKHLSVADYREKKQDNFSILNEPDCMSLNHERKPEYSEGTNEDTG